MSVNQGRYSRGDEDLEPAFDACRRARIPPGRSRDVRALDEGRLADFHALRRGYVTALAQAGVAPRVAQGLARHSTITLTLDRYTHVRPTDERDALTRLPSLAPTDSDDDTDSDTLRATGTDGSLAPNLSSEVAGACSATPLDAAPGGGEGGTRTPTGMALRILSPLSSEPASPAETAPSQGLAVEGPGSPEGGLGPQLAPSASADPSLAALVARWPALPDELRQAILRVAGIER